MAVLEGGVSTAVAGVGAEAASPLHVVSLPLSHGAGGHFRIGLSTGTMAAALASGSEFFQFRYVTAASRVAVVQRVTLSIGASAAATAAGVVPIRMTVARSWTADGSGGSAATLTGDNAQLRTAHSASEVSTTRISTTAALTAGTKTLDTTDIAAVSVGIGTGAITVAVPLQLLGETVLFEAPPSGGHPLILANQEGFVLRTGAAWPATMTWGASVNVHWTEVPAF